jgi:phenylpyruvate tautomerase PptA (4-oxalocrotonate tautomerase family)
MPTLKIQTNARIDAPVAEALIQRASTEIASLLGKPERYVMVIVEPVIAMSFGGETAPTAYLELKSLGLDEARTPEFSTALCTLMEVSIGVPQDRVYIEFSAPPRHMFGFDGGTF